MKLIKVKFVDWYIGFKPEDELIYQLLTKHYDVQLDNDSPDYIIDGGLGKEHLNYDCIKILRVGENIVPDFNLFDYAIGFDPIVFSDRYIRIPLYVSYHSFSALTKRDIPSPDKLLSREFCSIVVSNGGGDPMRINFFQRLNKNKVIASGGRYLNNVGGPVADKLAFCAKYKFNIAFENSRSLGYTTEKVMEPLCIHSIPIYYGNPDSAADFNKDCMVLVENEDDVERAVEEIIYLDTHDEAYLAKCFATPVKPDRNYESYCTQLDGFLKHIFEQPLSDACRLNRYGFQPVYRKRLQRINKIESFLKTIKHFPKKLMGL